MRTYKWRLYADENIEQALVTELRNAKFDVLWVVEDPALRKHKDDRFHFRKARELGRYLLTRDDDFWSDASYPLHQSPGVILLTSRNPDLAHWLVRLLRKLIVDYNPLPEPLHLDGVKFKLSEEGFELRMLDHHSQQKSTQAWRWRELF